jgi:hypothetical protein
MCERYSDEFGYICDECFQELVACGVKNVAKFMKSAKGTYHSQQSDYDFIDDLFPHDY